ncbi:MAG: HAD-IA family hydrolase [Lawsonibacter sp.]|nr:HAD-IA family hydrolase [Lawsonibacter sp.]
MPLKPGVREILDFLRLQGIPAALATSTGRVRTLRRLELTGLGEYFQTVVTGDQVEHSKPDPEIYLLACRALDTPPGQTLAVEDSRNGILSAHAAGMPVVMVPDMIPPAPELEALLWRRCASLSELRDVLLSRSLQL